MKVLFVASVYNHLTTFHIPYIKYFQQQGYEVWAAGIGEEDKKILKHHHVKCVDISFSRSPLHTDNFKAFKQLQKLFSQECFELVHVHTPIAALLTRVAFRKQKHGKIIYTAHGFHFFESAPKQNWLIYYPAEKLAAKWTDHLITINNEDYRNAHKLLPAEKISLVHGVGVEIALPKVSLENKRALKRQLGLFEDAIVISYVAELNDNKNHLFLLRNWQLLKQDNPKLELLIIGTGEKELTLKKEVAQRRLSGVHFLGYRNDVPKLLQISDIVTLLSHREGLPKSIMEAMSASLPCVVSNTRGLRDLITNGVNGFVVNHEDDKALIEAFTQLAQSQKLRIQMGEHAVKRVEPYLLEAVMAEYTTIYNSILKK